ncbi:MAG: protein translocase subunit SecF [Leptospirales bacterium]
MRLKWVGLTISVFLIIGGFLYTFKTLDGFREGIDFAGGIKIEMKVGEGIDIESVRSALKQLDVDGKVQIADKEVENLFKVEIGGQDEEALKAKALEHSKDLLKANYTVDAIDYVKYNFGNILAGGDQTQIKYLNDTHVGPSFGIYLRKMAYRLLLITLVLITIYITFRFRFVFAVGAMVALLHDLAMTMVVIGVFQIPLSTPVIAALLTILGYSINDTIVIFDRIRENQRGSEKINFEGQVNRSINQSLARTIITSLTTLIAIASVYILAQDTLQEMALVLIFGIIIGTYSSSFVASPVLVIWERYVNKVR